MEPRPNVITLAVDDLARSRLLSRRPNRISTEGGSMDRMAAEQFAGEWYAAWNAHDLDRILGHYTDDVEMTSPLVSVLTGEPGGQIVGKEDLRRYFAAGLETYPELHFEPMGLFVGVNSLVLEYASVNGRAAEVVFLDDQGKITRYLAHYAD
jgi:ketosteroid isomerase-like protein